MINTSRFCFAKLKSFIIYLFKKKSKPITVKPQKSKILNIAKKVLPPQKKKKTATKPTSQNTTKPTHIKKYIFPSIELLNKPKPEQPSNSNDASNKEKAIMLENILQEFKLTGKITGIKTGPVITLFEMLPGKSIKISDIKNLNEDIARKIKAIASTRIAVIPGTDKIGIELPNLHRQTVSLRTQFESNEFKNTTYKLPLSLGCDTMGNPIFVDLAKTPHLLVAGATGMGKSVGVNSMILSLLYKKHPDECKFIMIDPKAVEFSTYKDIPHLLTPIVTDVEKSVAALNWAIREMENRYSNMASIEVKDIESYNQKVKTMKGQFITRQKTTGFDPHTGAPITEDEKIELKPIPYIVIVVDEFADLMQSKEHKKEVETNISRLAAKARAAGIHLILTTQRPSVDVVTGLIKSNFPSRISYSVASGQDSRTIIDECGAERLLGKGDGLYKGNGNNSLVRIHAAFVTENEICNVTKFIKEQGKPNYIENEAIQKIQNQNTLATLDKSIIKKQRKEDLYAQAVEIVLTTGKTSISYLQRQLGIGFNPAASLMEQLEANGIVSAPDATNKRVILKKGI